MHTIAEAPSNIALIKYMGKLNSDENLPANPSLSYTLSHLSSTVSLETYEGTQDRWAPLPGSIPCTLSIPEQARFLHHLSYLKQTFDYTGTFTVRSCNNFPKSAGIASSASSFAALTQCACTALCELTHRAPLDVSTLSRFSRHGSGSSCRSFFKPWAIWDETNARDVALPYSELLHQLIIVECTQKKVSSSQAHRRVITSPYYPERPHRARERLKHLLYALRHHQWASAYELIWDDFQDMHHLFATSKPTFFYMTDATHTLLDYLNARWKNEGDGPLITLDAGANIHLLYRLDQKDLACDIRSSLQHYAFFESF